MRRRLYCKSALANPRRGRYNVKKGIGTMPNEEQRTPLTFEQRMDALAAAIEAEAREREKGKADFDARMEALTGRHEALTGRHEALTGRHEALTGSHEALTRRHEALTMNLELMAHESEAQRIRSERDAAALNALVRIAEIHERRLTDLEGPRPQ